MSEKIIEKRRELVFVYAVRDANPNGDPDDENRPRTDDEGYALVSDVRLKRTIRDYFLSNDIDVLVKRVYDKEGNIFDMNTRIIEALDEKEAENRNTILEKIPEKFIDARLFGFVGTVKGANCSLTGPVQFTIGKSLNKPTISTHTITSVLSGAKATGGAIGNFHILDYALIRFQGVVCPKLAKEAKMTEADLEQLYKGLWKGTQTLNTRTKFNHVPKLLLAFRSKDDEFLCGELAYQLAIREIPEDKSDPILIMDKLVERVKALSNGNLEAVEYLMQPGFKLEYEGKEYDKFEDFWKATGLSDKIKLELIKI
ncbi:MAG: type I-B CRISPR-associated protein Cas7/Csh2 [Promethearchaeia archaeon]